jgi:hypothetical protein
VSNPNCEICNGTGIRKISYTIGGDGYGGKCCGEMDVEGEEPCEFCGDYLSPAEERLAAEIEQSFQTAANQVKVWDHFYNKLMESK